MEEGEGKGRGEREEGREGLAVGERDANVSLTLRTQTRATRNGPNRGEKFGKKGANDQEPPANERIASCVNLPW